MLKAGSEVSNALVLYNYSDETARDNLEEGGDDVKSSCPL